ncbi:hypothetical protein [Bradyrhizobium sp.]|uniref:hypothetical protein n=1 Tax=Bradyrhizobium sp. TaxID=376 RepID=UPI003C6FD20D
MTKILQKHLIDRSGRVRRARGFERCSRKLSGSLEQELEVGWCKNGTDSHIGALPVCEVASGRNVPIIHAWNNFPNLKLKTTNRIRTQASRLGTQMATIELQRDNVDDSVWWLKWIEAGEIIGRIRQDGDGRCQIVPQGVRWSPMKSFGGRSFCTREAALAEVMLYFRGRWRRSFFAARRTDPAAATLACPGLGVQRQFC